MSLGTPPSGVASGNGNWIDHVFGTCPAIRDCSHRRTDDVAHNFMDYIPDRCANEWSNMQIWMMRWTWQKKRMGQWDGSGGWKSTGHRDEVPKYLEVLNRLVYGNGRNSTPEH